MTLETILGKCRAFAAALSLTAVIGCASPRLQGNATYLAPANAAIGYFGAVATHEMGHAVTYAALGADSVEVSVVPERVNGRFTVGYASYSGETFSGAKDSLSGISGPLANLFAHAGAREALKTGSVPRSIQPALQWYALMNKCQFYLNIINGFQRDRTFDLGREDLWVSAALLLAGISYDIYDIGTDSPERYFGVLIGNAYYEPQERSVELIVGSDFLGVKISW